MALMNADSLNLNLGELSSMEVAIKSNNQLTDKIDANASNYYTVDISIAMTNLGNVGEILKLAYAGSRGFPCSTSTLEILSRYQTMINNTYVTSSSFVDACLKALKLHKLALDIAERDMMDKSIKMLEKCADLAKTMADESGKLVKEATDLCNLSQEALLTAQDDENVSRSEKERIKKMMTESMARQAEMDSKTKQLHDQIEDYKTKMAELVRRSDEERQREFYLRTISAVVDPINKVAGSVCHVATSVVKVTGTFAHSMVGSKATDEFAQSMVSGAVTDAVTDAIAQSMVDGIATAIPTNKAKKTGNVFSKMVSTITGLVAGRETAIPKNEGNKTASGSEATTYEEGVQQQTNKASDGNKTASGSEATTNEEGVQQQTNKASDVNNNASASAILAQQENEIMKLKAELQKEEREANAEIAKIGVILKDLKGEEADLTASIKSLEMAIKALGKVKTTFEQTKQFWLGVEKHCKALTDISVITNLNDPLLKDMFIEELKKSGLSWLTLGKINYSAQRSISEVGKRTDNILSNLPTKSEALEIVKKDIDFIICSLQNEVSAIE